MDYADQMALPGSLQGSPLEGSPGLDPGRTLRASVSAVRAAQARLPPLQTGSSQLRLDEVEGISVSASSVKPATM